MQRRQGELFHFRHFRKKFIEVRPTFCGRRPLQRNQVARLFNHEASKGRVAPARMMSPVSFGSASSDPWRHRATQAMTRDKNAFRIEPVRGAQLSHRAERIVNRFFLHGELAQARR